MPIVLANQSTSGIGGIQRFMSRVAQALAVDEPIVLIEPAGTGSPVQSIEYWTFRPGRRISELARAFVLYVRATSKRRGDYTLASIWFPSGLLAALVPRPIRGRFGVMAYGSEIAPNRGGIRRAMMRFVFSQADAIFVLGNHSAALLREAGVKREPEIILCGVDVSDESSSDRYGNTLLSVGRLVARKGFDRTIEAMPAILRAVPDARYEIVGDGPQRAELETLAKRLGVADRILFRGAVSDEELKRAYDRATCFVLPTRRIADDVEGFGLVYIEAAMAGLACIGGAGSGAEDAIVDGTTGILVDGSDVDAIARAVITLLQDRKLAKAMGDAGRARAIAEFSWRTVAGKIRERLCA